MHAKKRWPTGRFSDSLVGHPLCHGLWSPAGVRRPVCCQYPTRGQWQKTSLRQIILSPLESVYWFTSKYLWDGYHSSSGWIWEIWIVCKCCLVNTPHGIFNREPLMGLLWKWNRNLGKKNNTHQRWYLSCYALCSDQKLHLYLINK